MSQRLKAGFSWPGFSVAAGDPFEMSPWSPWARADGGVGACPSFTAPAKRATSFNGRALCVSSLPGFIAPLQSRLCGVGLADASRTWSRSPICLCWSFAACRSADCCVGQEAAAIVGRSEPGPFRPNSFIAPRWVRAPFSPSVALAVGHGASRAASLIENCFFVPLGRVFADGSRLVRPPSALLLSGVGDPVQPLSDVWSADAVCAEIRRRWHLIRM